MLCSIQAKPLSASTFMICLYIYTKYSSYSAFTTFRCFDLIIIILFLKSILDNVPFVRGVIVYGFEPRPQPARYHRRTNKYEVLC